MRRWMLDALLLVAVALGYFVMGFAIGRDAGRIDALRAEPAPALAVADKHRAWQCVVPKTVIRWVHRGQR